jgi:hypothetical protein
MCVLLRLIQVTAISAFMLGSLGVAVIGIASPRNNTVSNKQTSPKKDPNIIEQNKFKFEFQGCQRNSQMVDCSLLVTNLDKNNRRLDIVAYYNNTKSRIFDNLGTVYWAKEIQFGSEKDYYVKVPMIQGIPVKAVVSYEVNSDVSKFSAVEVNYYQPDTGWGTLVYRNVTLASQ